MVVLVFLSCTEHENRYVYDIVGEYHLELFSLVQVKLVVDANDIIEVEHVDFIIVE